MKKALLFVSLTALLVPGLALAQDAGQPEACDPATAGPDTCNGDTVTGCDPDSSETFEVNCAEVFADLGNATCGTSAGMDTCVMATGGACLASSGGQLFNVPCANASDGCGLAPNAGWVCTAGGPSCTPAAEGEQFAPTCSGNDAVWQCNAAGQAIYDDCTAIGGTCDQGIFCVDVQEGGLCDGTGAPNAETGPYWPCAAGLVCEGLSDTTYGACAPATNTGEGEGEGEGSGEGEGEDDENPRRGDDEEEPEPEGGCLGNAAMNSAVPPSLGLIALLGVLAIRRRRR